MKFIKKYGWKGFFSFIFAPITFALLLGFGIFQSFMNRKTKKAVEKAQDKQAEESVKDASDAQEVVVRQEGHQEAVVETIENIKQTTEPGSDERLNELSDELAKMSRKRREEALRRARRS